MFPCPGMVHGPCQIVKIDINNYIYVTIGNYSLFTRTKKTRRSLPGLPGDKMCQYGAPLRLIIGPAVFLEAIAQRPERYPEVLGGSRPVTPGLMKR